MAIPTGRFVWFDYVAPDVKKAQGFYGELFNWSTQDVPMPDGAYTMIARERQDDRPATCRRHRARRRPGTGCRTCRSTRGRDCDEDQEARRQGPHGAEAVRRSRHDGGRRGSARRHVLRCGSPAHSMSAPATGRARPARFAGSSCRRSAGEVAGVLQGDRRVRRAAQRRDARLPRARPATVRCARGVNKPPMEAPQSMGAVRAGRELRRVAREGEEARRQRARAGDGGPGVGRFAIFAIRRAACSASCSRRAARRLRAHERRHDRCSRDRSESTEAIAHAAASHGTRFRCSVTVPMTSSGTTRLICAASATSA